MVLLVLGLALYFVRAARRREWPWAYKRRQRTARQLRWPAAGSPAIRQTKLSPDIAVNVVVQLLDGLPLHGNDPLDQVADGKNAHYFIVFEHRQVTDAAAGHDAHAILNGVLRTHGKRRAVHDVADAKFLEDFPVQHHFAGVVALGKNSEQAAFRDDQQRADAFFGHHGHGVIDPVFGITPRPADPSAAEHSDGISKFHGRLSVLAMERKPAGARRPLAVAPRCREYSAAAGGFEMSW